MIAIIALISAVALPTVLPALNERRVSESARVLQAILAGTRDAAIRANAPRGIRLLPDPIFNGQYDNNGGYNPLASNRIIPIEPGPDYTEGLVTSISLSTAASNVGYPAILTYYGTSNYLILGESPSTAGIPNNPTNWFNNIRQGDKIRFNDSGAYYTIAGPINGLPVRCRTRSDSSSASSSGDGLALLPERLGARIPLPDERAGRQRNGWVDEGFDGIDNDGDGIIDPGFNGIDDDGVNGIDDPAELHSASTSATDSGSTPARNTSKKSSSAPSPACHPSNEAYTIFRRPVVSPGARETTLPAGVVIDLTTWNAPAASTRRHDAGPPARAVPAAGRRLYGLCRHHDRPERAGRHARGRHGRRGRLTANSPLSNLPFYHFWLTEREGVVPPLCGYQVNSQAT